jgi:hypothetical protein
MHRVTPNDGIRDRSGVGRIVRKALPRPCESGQTANERSTSPLQQFPPESLRGWTTVHERIARRWIDRSIFGPRSACGASAVRRVHHSMIAHDLHPLLSWLRQGLFRIRKIPGARTSSDSSPRFGGFAGNPPFCDCRHESSRRAAAAKCGDQHRESAGTGSRQARSWMSTNCDHVSGGQRRVTQSAALARTIVRLCPRCPILTLDRVGKVARGQPLPTFPVGWLSETHLSFRASG